VITTCSKHNFDYVKSLGADAVFDYSSPTVGADIRKHTNDKLFYVWDTIAEGTTPQICADALSSQSLSPSGKKLQYGCTLSATCPRDDVESKPTMGYTALGEAFSKFGREFPAKPEDFQFSVMFTRVAEKIIKEGKVKPHRYEVRPGGLDGILDGLKDMKDGKISGKKVVYRVVD
jgi:NADPH:quinone reductase-like Zn-dependent oxidoreductase